MLSKNYEKLPTKLIHTHAYNGFHQEIKVHASHLPKDATKLLKVLATSLDNSALANISQRLLTSSNSISNNHDSKIPLDHQVVQSKLLGEGNVLNTQSSKLITSGSQSNETILVIPNTEPLNDQNSQSVLPLTSKHETIWKSVSSPASLGFNNNKQINPHSSQEKLNVYYYDNPPSISTDQNNMIRNPSKFSRPGFPHMLPTKPTRNTQSINPASKPKSSNGNNGKMSYAPLPQKNKQFKPTPGFVSKRDEFPHLRLYQQIKPGPNQVFNYTSSNPIFRPGKFIVPPNNNGGQQKPLQSQFIPNLSKYYPNHVTSQEIQFKPNQNHLPKLNNKGIQYLPLFSNNPNQPIVAANQYKQPQIGLKPGQGSVSPLNSIGNQTDQQFKAFPPSFQINPPLINLPNQKKRISSIANEGSKKILPHSTLPNSTALDTNILYIPQTGVDSEHTQNKSSHSQFVPNHSIYYRNEYETPKIIEVNPDQEQLIPHPKISYTHTDHYNPTHTSSKPSDYILIPKIHNKTRKYNNTHSHYEKHTTITYASEYDPTHPGNPLQVMHDPNLHQNAPQTNVYELYLPDQESQELDLIMSKVNYYLNLPNLQHDQNVHHPKLTHYYSSQTSFLPGHRQNYTLKVHPTMTDINKYDQNDSWNITNDQFDKYPHSPSDDKNTDLIKSFQNRTIPTNSMYLSQSQFILSQENSNETGLSDPESAEGLQLPFNSAEYPTNPKRNENLPQTSQTGPTQSPPGAFDDWGSTNGFQYALNVYEDPRQLKPIYKLPFFDERGSADGFQYPSNSAEDLIHPKLKLNKSPDFDPYTSIVKSEQPNDNLHISPHSQFGPALNQHKPGVFDNREIKDGFQYAHNADENSTHLKPLHKLLPFTHSYTPFGSTLIQHSPGKFDERASADGFQYPSNSAENPIHSRGNLHNPKLIEFGSTQNQHLPGIFYERGSADGFHYPFNSAENPLQPKDNLNKLLHNQFGPTQNQHTPGMFDERDSTDGFHYPSNSAENPLQSKDKLNKLLHIQFGPTQNQQLLGVFDENPAHPKENMHKPSNSLSGPNAYKQLPGMLDKRESADGFQYPSNFVESPLYPKENKHKSQNSQFGPTTHNQLPRIYPSNSAGNPTHPKNFTPPEQNKQTLPHSQVGLNNNKPKPGIFDSRGYPDGAHYPSNSAENLTHLKSNPNTTSESKFTQPQNQYNKGGSADGFQYPSNSAENPTHLKQNKQIQPNSPFGPTQNQHLPGMFDNRGSADGFKYPSNSVENPTHPKNNLHKLPQSQFPPSPNQHVPGVLDDRGSADGFQNPSNSAENPTHPKQNKQIQPYSQFGPTQNQHTPGFFDDRGSADGAHYPSNSAENPTHLKNIPNTTPESKFTQPQNQLKPSSLDDGYSNTNPLRPWMYLDHDQYKPSSFDNVVNGVHNIPWSFSGDHNNNSETVTSAPKPRFIPDYDQYKPSSFDNLLNGIHQIPWSVPNQDNNALGSDPEITTPHSGFKHKQDQYGLSMVKNPSISNQNKNTDLTDVDDNQPQIEQDVSTPSTDLTDSDSTQYNVLYKLKPDSDSDTLLPTDDGKIPDYYDRLYPLFKAVKKLSDPPIVDSVFSVGSTDQLDLLPFLFPSIAKILNYEHSRDQDDVPPVDNHEVQRINPLSKLKSKLNQTPLPENDNGILSWLKSKLNKLAPTKDNATVTKNDIDMTKIFNLLSKLTLPKQKHTTALQNIPFSGFDPEIIENMNDFKENTLTTTSSPRADSTYSYENRFKSVPTKSEESRSQTSQLKYPDVHIILHQPNDEDDVELPPYIETDGERYLATYTDSEELSDSMFPKIFNPRFRHRPKDQKEECGDGTQWISNCHGCSCYFGQAMCFRLPDCDLKPLGEPMTCKPYSHFKMGCYICECNGDGIAECDATDCNTQPNGKSKVSGSTESPLPIITELFDTKKTNEILQYYDCYKKLPKDCPKQDLQTQYPTCEQGTSWVSSCHKCECNESGKHECTRIDDCKLDVDSYGQPGRCKPNSKFYPKKTSMPCVECSCNDEGNPYCPEVDYKKH